MIYNKFKYIFPALFIFLFPQNVFAGESPQLSSPTDRATVSSSKLEWQAPSYPLYSGNNYRVQVDDESSFSSLNKDYYTDNTYYSPTLSDGIWYWRVKAKDADKLWSGWSSVWSFTLTSNTTTPSPSPSDLPDPTPSPSATTNPTSTPSPQSTSSSQNSFFLISQVPLKIDSGQSFSVSANLSLPNNQNTKFYLKGAFKKADSSNYFGYTKVLGAWIKNGTSYSLQYPITTDSSGSWRGSLELQVDGEDSGFTGSGDYIFKVGRYTQSGSGPTWSNEVTINIIAIEVEVNNEGGTDGSDTIYVNTPKPSSTAFSIGMTSPNKASIIRTPQNLKEGESSVAGIESSPQPSSDSEKLVEREVNYMPWIGGGFILAGISSLGLLYLKNKGLYEKFFKLNR